MESNSNLLHELEQSKESLKFALQSARMFTWDIDIETDTVKCSEDMLKLWGIDPLTFSGRREVLQSKVHPDDLENMRQAINESIKNDGIYEFEYRIHPTPGTEKWILSRGRCTFEPGSDKPVRFSGVVFDITENKKKDEALSKAMKERELFLTLASHELKTPLTCLHLQLFVLENEMKEKHQDIFTNDYVSSSFKKQKEQLLRLTHLVDNIFEQTQILDGTFTLRLEKFDVIKTLKEIVSRYQHENIELYCDAESIEGHWDRFRLEQVFLNLITNAIRFGEKKPVEIKVSSDNGKVFITFKDQGRGIRLEDQERIFDRFSNISGESGGMGFGLYLAHSIVKSHGGKIHLKSEPEKGSEFTVVLNVQ